VTKIGANEDFPTVTPQPTVFSLVSISEEELELDFVVYPNPAQGSFFVQISDPSSLASFQLLDLSGQLVLSGNLDINKEVSIAEMKSGCYTLVVNTSEGRSLFKRVVILQ
jgi:sugar/nucleoside kinase (ribokinase family)